MTASPPFIRNLARTTWVKMRAPDWALKPLEWLLWLALFVCLVPRVFLSGVRRGYRPPAR